ncbi:HAD family hydrolase [Paenarthrobacter nicotinovorans]|jgi:phosphonatase-like hydrolase|uniref:HAD family hydrolase n=1 Tax=Paenarthrobacter nicotinovorans TaxID=29320 RepID=UPI001E735439|nr:putative haloacid dehalogenase-like hydrolase [Arthrobacter sp. NtRootA2]BCW13603.1 putative haloacid dehalogenase-like hydrolase [Arthrobacter sp. NtRootA4]BCW21939.1 putative haloacid dehalogenase-like hydrolase [Arthrobacter sp. NtRootC7]BCW26207.1 putative haloacid dehalogenase-like hydrolase [Arthrobacter sp. NtRootC45]BCW30476.1 putative haloacid dehalogenase-like hydrolase [Arthrobacter sp. NtRootD5]
MTGDALTRDANHTPNRLKLAVVDMVGTTITDDGRTGQAMSRALVEHGIEPGSSRFESMLGYARDTMGFSKMTVFSHLFEDPAVARSANNVFERAYDDMIADGGVRPIPGAEDAILWMREAGMQVCLATGFGRHTQNMVLESLGWMGLADLSLCPADAGRGRPYPDMILTAVLALDLDDVREVAVVGDTSSDMLSGVRSGASLVAGVLTGSHSEATLRAAGATAVVDSIKQLPLLVEKREARHL